MRSIHTPYSHIHSNVLSMLILYILIHCSLYTLIHTPYTYVLYTTIYTMFTYALYNLNPHNTCTHITYSCIMYGLRKIGF